MNKLSTERAIEALYTVRAYYASLTAGYPKGKDCKGIDDVTCGEIANSCLMAITSLEQEPCEDAISRQAAIDGLASIAKAKAKSNAQKSLMGRVMFFTEHLPSVTPQQKMGKWIAVENEEMKTVGYYCSKCDLPMETEQRTKFCPNCGTKMEVSENE